MKKILIAALLLGSYTAFCANSLLAPKLEINSRKVGMLLGLQQGAYTSLELGMEGQWKKLKLKDPWTIAVNGTVQYNLQNNILAYKMGSWFKLGRTDLSLGANAGFFTDFGENRFAIGPEIGFKLVGFHVYTGGNFQLHPDPLDTINTFYVGIRYFLISDRKVKFNRDKKNQGNRDNKKKN